MIELRSDTFTKADEKMRNAMAFAEVGDDVYGEDPTVNKLQELAATAFGKEKALFVPSGTMGNLLAVLAVCQRGDEIIMDYYMHMFQYEVAGISALAGVQINPLKGFDGKIPLDLIKDTIRKENIHFPTTRMIALENTHNISGGKVLELNYINAVAKLAKENDLHFHIDGARLYNAMIALEVEPKVMLENVDSAQICLSKGLGAPMGSILLGSAEFIDKALKYRKMLGGGMRQWGHAAAAGIIALEEGPANLIYDHKNCDLIATELRKHWWVTDVQSSTNICRFQIPKEELAVQFEDYMLENGVRVQRGGTSLRVVTHRNLTENDIQKVVALIGAFKGGN